MQKRKKYTATIPFNQEGSTFGATEGVGNLYNYVCNNDKQSKFEISNELESSEIILEKPSDIFQYLIK